ncbi:hypothetical protein GCM10027048_27620 [Hymenobacter coalescens]
MTIADLTYDRTTPDAAGLVLPVSVTATGEALGELRCTLEGRPNRKVLRWKAYELSGTSAGPIWPTRDEAAVDLLPLEAQEAARTSLSKGTAK